VARPRRNSRDPTRRTTLTARPPSLLRPPPCVDRAACARADPTRPAPSARRSIQDHSVVVALALSTHRGTGAPPVWSSRADNRLSPAGESLCGGECVDTTSELRSCGRCGNDCGAIANAFGVGCEQGRCVVCASHASPVRLTRCSQLRPGLARRRRSRVLRPDLIHALLSLFRPFTLLRPLGCTP